MLTIIIIGIFFASNLALELVANSSKPWQQTPSFGMKSREQAADDWKSGERVELWGYTFMASEGIEIDKGGFQYVLDTDKNTCLTFTGQQKSEFYLNFGKIVSLSAVAMKWDSANSTLSEKRNQQPLLLIFPCVRVAHERRCVMWFSCKYVKSNEMREYDWFSCDGTKADSLLVSIPAMFDDNFYTYDLCDVAVMKRPS